MKNFIAYCRTSTENQREEKTIELQVDMLNEYARKHSIDIVQWFKDDGVSGGLKDRPQLLMLMKCLETNNDIEGVIIYKLDRLARDLYIQEGLIKEFAKLKKVVISTLEPDLASNDPFRNAFRQMLGVFSEFEKAMITLRMKNGRNNAVAKGKWHGGQIYGYNNKNGELTTNPEEAKTIKRMFYLKRYKKLSPYKIAKLLQEEGVETKRKNTKWRPLTIAKMLKNRAYKGYITYNGQEYKGKQEPIIK